MSGKPYRNVLIYNTIEKVKKHWDELKADIQVSNTSYLEKWLTQIPFFQQVSFHNSISIALWDIVSNRFLFAIDERKIVQYDMSLYTAEGGVEFSLNNFHPDYINAMYQMQQNIASCLALNIHLPVDRMMANIDGLYRIKNGSYIHILQQIVPVEIGSNGYPFLYLSYVRDITHLKKHPSATLIFTTPAESKFWNYSFGSKQLESVRPFTTQESKVLHLLSEGKQTKEMAEILSVSQHTINTHRRRLLAKTSCVDTTALIAYSQMTGLL